MLDDERDRLFGECHTDDALWHWIKTFCGLEIPRTALCPNHVAPFEYIRRAYFEPATDLIVWGPRGGGKTRLGALATLLDLLHKPGVQIKILGGSLEQSLRMWEHLLSDVEILEIGHVKSRKIEVVTGSKCGVLTQSQRAVRGVRVQKLRCDEVELFDPAVWEAAQLVTKSRPRAHLAAGLAPRESAQSPLTIAGTIEALSTLHAPIGLMGKIVDSAAERGTPVLRWCLLEVLEKCPAERECSSCLLWDECQGRAKTMCSGFVSIDDAIKMKRRVCEDTWKSEMLCQRPSVRGRVFPMFDIASHVREVEARPEALSMDFGFANPFVCLWIGCIGDVVHVMDEYVQSARTIEEHLREIESRRWGKISRVTCDPAGGAANEQTGQSTIHLLRKNGYAVRSRKSVINEGVELIRSALKSASGEVRLAIHPRCKKLIEAMQGYRYEEGGGEKPLKDGVFDHPIDALRYWFVNRNMFVARGGKY